MTTLFCIRHNTIKKLPFLLLFTIPLTGCEYVNDLGLEVTSYITIYKIERFYEEKPDFS